MNRQTLVTIHLYLAAFLTPIVLMIAISGGLYLFGLKGTSVSTQVYQGDASEFDFKSADSKAAVDDLFSHIGIEHDFEYTKGSSTSLVTRPTSRDYYVIAARGDSLTVTLEQPDLIKRIVELHKGHGPGLFKTLQKITAFGLVFIFVSGLWIAWKTPPMRNTMATTAGAGFLVWLVLAIL